MAAVRVLVAVETMGLGVRCWRRSHTTRTRTDCGCSPSRRGIAGRDNLPLAAALQDRARRQRGRSGAAVRHMASDSPAPLFTILMMMSAHTACFIYVCVCMGCSCGVCRWSLRRKRKDARRCVARVWLNLWTEPPSGTGSRRRTRRPVGERAAATQRTAGNANFSFFLLASQPPLLPYYSLRLPLCTTRRRRRNNPRCILQLKHFSFR